MRALNKSLRLAPLAVALSAAIGFCLLAYSGSPSIADGVCELQPQAGGNKITQNQADEIAVVDAKIAEVDSEIAEKTQQFDRLTADVNREKVEALKDLTAQLNKLNADRLKLAGKFLEQSAIDAQLAVIQQKINQVSGPLDDRLKEIGLQRQAQLQALKERLAALVARRESFKPPCPHYGDHPK